MLGHEGVVRALTMKLRERVPPMVEQLRSELQVDARAVPMVQPQDIHGSEVDVIGKGRFPVLMVTQEGTGIQQSTRQVDVFADRDEYEFRYRCRIILWATGESYEHTELMRKRLMLGLRMALLSDRIIYNDGNGEYASIDQGYLREQFSELAQDNMGKLLAGGYIEVEIVANEVLTLSTGGPRAIFEVQTSPVQDDPFQDDPAPL